jgi:ADP-heptose:LPS heptosyltransferase
VANKIHHSILRLIFSRISRNDAAPPPFSAAEVRNVLIINTTAIGDTLMCTPAIRAIRKGLPGARITALASASARSVLDGSAHIDAFIKYPGRINLGYLFKIPGLVSELRRFKFDLVIELHATDPDKGPLSYMTGARWRMGSERSLNSFLYTHRVPPYLPGVHTVRVALKNLALLGIEDDGSQMELFLNDADRAEASRAFPSLAEEKYITIHPFGSKANKWWPEKNVKEFCALLKGLGYVPIIIGGSSEARGAAEIASGTGAISAAGALSIRGSAALIEKSALLVTTDSGPMHIAGALKVPTIALFGADDPVRTGPLNPGDVVIQKELDCVPCRERKCRYPAVECMESITPEEVFDEVKKRLSQSVQKNPA